MSREKLTTEIIKERARKVHGDKYDLSPLEFLSCKEKIKYRCHKHGMIHQRLFDFLNGHGCRKCFDEGHSGRWSIDQDELLKKHYKSNGAYWCAEQTGKTPISVRGRANALNLMKTKRIPHKHIPSFLWTNLISRVKEKGYNMNITTDFIWNLFNKQNGKCALTGWDIVFSSDRVKNTASIDRIDSDKDYTEDNIQLTHKIVNRCKLNCPEDLFYNICKSITENRKHDFIQNETVWIWDEWHDTEIPKRVERNFDNLYTLLNNKIHHEA
jgi:hypothetical protein